MPIFFFAVVSLLFLMEIMSIQTAVRSGLQYAGKLAAEEAYPTAVLRPGKVEQDVTAAIGADRLGRSLVEGGIDCSRSRMSLRTGVAELSAVYHVRVPLPVFRIPLLEYEETMRVKGWTGYERTGFGTGERGDGICDGDWPCVSQGLPLYPSGVVHPHGAPLRRGRASQ